MPYIVSQNFIHRSAVPPPETNNPLWCGDQVSALTAALCEVNRHTGSNYFWGLQTSNLLSLPPEASYYSSNDHFSPQISYLWPESLLIKLDFDLKS